MLDAIKSRRSGQKLNLGKYCVVIASLVLLFAEVQAQSGAWTRKTELRIPRLGVSAGVVNGKIYVSGAGGCGASCHADLAANEVYDPSTDKWETKAPMPTPRGFPSAAVVRDTLYVMGGAYPTLLNPKTTVEAYDPVANTWTSKADMLSPRIGAQAAVVDGIVYNIGGNINEPNCEAYDPRTNRWTPKKPIPESGGVLSVTVYNGLIYAFGGGYYGAFSSVYAYNPQTDTWTKKRDMPTARFGLQTLLVDGKIYAIGGSQAENTALATVEVYDPVSDTWQSKPGMPENRTWFGGAVVNNKIYVIGGSSDFRTAKSTLWEYDPAFHTDIAAGNVSGTWMRAGSPYHITGEITVPNDSTLLIEPGVEVVFLGHYKLNVQGRLLAVGTQEDTIQFRAADTQTGWHGIRFDSTASTNDTSKIVYSVLRNGKANTGSGFDRCGGAILIREFDRVLVSNCLLDSNMQSGEGWEPIPEAGPAMCIYHASPVIMNSVFSHHTGSKGCAIACLACPKAIISNNVFRWNIGAWAGPIVVRGSGSPIISGNTISDNVGRECAGGISVETGASPRIENNIITSNWAPLGGAILCWQYAHAVLLNNTIAYNTASQGGGILCSENSDPILINNILYGNTAAYGSQAYLADGQSDPVFLYCNVQGGTAGFAGPGAGANYTGRYEDNMNTDPWFLNAESSDYRLSDSSECIGAAVDSIEISGVWYHAPLSGFGGNARPMPAGSRPDMGAFESPLGSPVAGPAFAHSVRLTWHGRDTVGITARVENPLAHAVNVVGILTTGSGVLVDSVFLKDDGLHGDGAPGDSVWGSLFAPKVEGTYGVTVRTDDITAGMSRTLANVAEFVFTQKAIISLDTRQTNLGGIDVNTPRRDTTFVVRNIGFGPDSLSVLLDYVNVEPQSAVAVSPSTFQLMPGASQAVTFTLYPRLLAPKIYNAGVVIESHFGYGTRQFEKVFVFAISGVLAVHDGSGALPKFFALDQNYPNPFNPTTVVSYQLPAASDVKAVVYDLLGREVSVLVNERKAPGSYEVKFNASNLSSGLYLYRITAGTFVQTRKMVLVR